MKILIFGASGSGTSTLGRELEKKLSLKHLDVDDYYWEKTDPPFQEKVPLTTRNKKLKEDFKKYSNVAVSGSMVSWGKEWETAFDLAIFIRLDNAQRMDRLKTREVQRYGEKLITDKVIRQSSKDFLEWANQYEKSNFKGRSLDIHKKWMELLECKVLLINGSESLEQLVTNVSAEIKNLSTIL